MYLNKKGFTLVEMLAVVVLLGMLMIFAIPNIQNLIQMNKNESYDKLKDTLIVGARNLFSDYRYSIEVDSSSNSDIRNVKSIKMDDKEEPVALNGKIPVSLLIKYGYIEANNDTIKNPKDNCELNPENIYITVFFDNKKRDYVFSVSDDDLECK